MNDLTGVRENLKRIGARFSVAQNACGCSRCKSMCTNMACFPSPAEAEELVRRYGDRMVVDTRYRTNERALKITRPLEKSSGACTFLVDGKCELHAQGLKPIEGRLASHTLEGKQAEQLRYAVVMLWDRDR